MSAAAGTAAPAAPAPTPVGRDAAALMVLLCATWGLGQVAIKVGATGFPPLVQAGLRSCIALALVLAWCAARRVPLFGRDGTLPGGLLAGALFAAEFLALFEGMARTTAARGVLFLYTAPFFVAIGAHLVLPGERIGRVAAAGLLCAFAGLALALSGPLLAGSAGAADTLVGDLLCLLAALGWAATTVVIKASRLRSARAEKTLAYQLAMSALLLPLGLALGEPLATAPGALAWAALLYQGVGVAFASYAAWFWLVRRHAAAALSSFGFLTPLFGAGFAAALLGEAIAPSLLGGLALVCAGIVLVNRAPRHAGGG